MRSISSFSSYYVGYSIDYLSFNRNFGLIKDTNDWLGESLIVSLKSILLLE